jgi:hypothetical protein
MILYTSIALEEHGFCGRWRDDAWEYLVARVWCFQGLVTSKDNCDMHSELTKPVLEQQMRESHYMSLADHIDNSSEEDRGN